jgi:nitrogen regulatory protein P-II 2
MKLITAIIKPFKLDDVREAIANLGVEGLTVSEVKGLAARRGTPNYTGSRVSGRLLPKVKLEIATADDNVEGVIEAICKAAYTGKIGDGKIFVYDLLQAVRIRTGERRRGALIALDGRMMIGTLSLIDWVTGLGSIRPLCLNRV